MKKNEIGEMCMPKKGNRNQNNFSQKKKKEKKLPLTQGVNSSAQLGKVFPFYE